MTALGLKMIALITMTIDHVGMVIFPDVVVYRIIGRVAFPLYAYLAAEGCRHTGNPRRYLMRLGLFALVSELPFNLARVGKFFHPQEQNIFFTLLLGVAACLLYSHLRSRGNPATILPPVLLCLLGQLLRVDYGWYGVAMIFAFYLAERKLPQSALALTALTAVSQWPAIAVVMMRPELAFYAVQLWCLLALLPIAFYNGRRGGGPKLLFYWYYPAHLLGIYLLSLVL